MTTLGGAVVDTMFYDAYGNMVKRTGADKTPFLYVGKYGVETDNNGLYYMRARYYNPQIQRFINVDPIRDGENWYGYCGRNPLINIDVSGLEFIVVSGGKYAIKEHGGYDYNFIEPAIKYFIELRDKNKDEDISWCIANEGWSAEDWQRFEDIASSYNVDIIVINSSQDLLNYINYKNIAGITDEGRNYRDEDQIKKFCVFAHGNAKKLLLGYNYDDANYNVSLNFNMEMIDNVRAEAFDNPNSWFNSCNAATGGKNSFLYKWHTKVGGFSGGYADFTLYYYIMYPQNYRNAVLDYNISKEIKEKRKDYGFSKTGSKRYPIGENNSKPVIYK